jgi:hypothetical protein
MMAVVHCRVDGNFLSNSEVVDISPNLINGATELVSKCHWEFCAGVRIFGALRRYEDRASQVFVEVSAADAAIRHLESDFIPATCTDPM